MKVQVVPVSALGAPECARWSELQRARTLYRSPFFRPEFATAVGRVREVRVGVIEDGGSVIGFFPFEVGRLRSGRPLGWPYSDYHGAVLDGHAAVDPRELVRACGLATWSFDHLPADLTAFEPYARARGSSPCLDLSQGFEPYLGERRARSDVRSALRKARKLEREVGPLRLVAACDDAGLLARTIEWKRLQYAETGVRDVLADSTSHELLRHMHESRGDEFTGVLSVLYAGDVVAGLHLGLRTATIWHSWFPVYNPDLHRYSPGLVHLLELADAAASLGITELDLGKGKARYKDALATGSVPLLEGSVGSGGLSALPVRMQNRARRTLRSVGLHRAARRALRRAR